MAKLSFRQIADQVQGDVWGRHDEPEQRRPLVQVLNDKVADYRFLALAVRSQGRS